GGFGEMGVLVVHVVLADVDHRQLPQRREIHDFVKRALAERTFTKKADRDLMGAQMFCGEGGAGGDTDASAHDGVGPEVAGGGIGDMHRSTFAFAVPGFFTEQFGKHAVGRGALGETVSVAAMRAGDVVVFVQHGTDADRNRFFADVEMGEPRHESAGIDVVHMFFEKADRHHVVEHLDPLRTLRAGIRLRTGCHCATPDMRASTSNTTAKSFFSKPMPRAAVRNSLVTAVVGRGMSSWRPSSMASNMSFCIMLTSNQASSGCSRTKGPRYLIIGEATALFTRTSTATLRAMPLFSASRTPSQKASICTARLRLMPIFMARARPLSPTCVTLGPMSWRRVLIFPKVSLRPPTMMESLPSCRVMTLPETGASTISAPVLRTRSAAPRLTCGLTVEISIRVF